MKLMAIGPDLTGSWSRGLESSRYTEFVPGTPYAAFGVALLWYKPERRLSISIWSRSGSWNFRLWGPRLLSWQR